MKDIVREVNEMSWVVSDISSENSIWFYEVIIYVIFHKWYGI